MLSLLQERTQPIMKRILFLFLALVCIAETNAQTQYKYWIVFTDKNGSPYSLSNPSAFLSQRAIYRRTKYGIPIQMNDLPPNPNYIDSVLAKGAILYNRSGWFNAISVAFKDTANMDLVRALPFVMGTKNVTIMKPPKSHKQKPFTDKKAFQASADTTNYGQAYGQAHIIGVDCLNNAGYRGKGKQIAVIDTRYGNYNTLAAFDSLRNRNQILGTWDFVWEKPIVSDDSIGDIHGEWVLSCMAANMPGTMVGDAVDAQYYLLRTEDLYSEEMIEDDNWASGAEYADSAGADIITTSLGYNILDDPSNSYTYADMNGRTAVASIAATIAAEKGMVVCAAAGNDGANSWHYISTPADADSILTVGAVTSTGQYASFSSTGPTSDGRLKPNVAAEGAGGVEASPYGGVTYENGTSFATPEIAGAVASLWQADSMATNMQIINAIEQSATQYSHPDSLLGYGIPNFCQALNILTGITENKPVSMLVKTFPNPFTNNITVAFYSSFTQNIQVNLYNSIGQVVYEKIIRTALGGNTVITLNQLQNLASGLYLVTLTDEKGIVYSQKEIKE